MSRALSMLRQVRRAQVPRPAEPVHELDRMSEAEFLEYLVLRTIERAELQGDLEAANKWRRCLPPEREQLIEEFLAIDEMSIPHAESDQVPMVQEEHTIYPLSRLMYRMDKARIQYQLARDRLFFEDFEAMLWWLEAYAPPQQEMR